MSTTKTELILTGNGMMNLTAQIAAHIGITMQEMTQRVHSSGAATTFKAGRRCLSLMGIDTDDRSIECFTVTITNEKNMVLDTAYIIGLDGKHGCRAGITFSSNN